MAKWLCEKDFLRMCKMLGRELEIITVPHFGCLCIICGKVADHLVSVSEEDIIKGGIDGRHENSN